MTSGVGVPMPGLALQRKFILFFFNLNSAMIEVYFTTFFEDSVLIVFHSCICTEGLFQELYQIIFMNICKLSI